MAHFHQDLSSHLQFRSPTTYKYAHEETPLELLTTESIVLIVVTSCRAHPTVHAVSPSGVPLVLRQRSQNGLGARTGVGDLTSSPGGSNFDNGGNRGNLSVLPPIKDSGKRTENFSLSELDDISLKYVN